MTLLEAVKKINKTGEFDKVDIQYYLENSEIALTERFIELIIHFLEITNNNLERAVAISSGTIQMEEI